MNDDGCATLAIREGMAMSCLPWSGFVPTTIYGRHWGFLGVFLETCQKVAKASPSLWLTGCSLTVRRGNFVQSQLLLLIYFAAPPSFHWVAASRDRGDFAQAQLQKLLLPLFFWPKEGPAPCSDPWAGPPLTAL